ncbi:hypothetical protein FGW37_01195 [Streptomyces rectiverticillatus]|uniref:hypothetical protein n=1 Tax=Streptomyces rectiverticillatus TaxID=173860 RepID=UPI0015C318EC|nr:hypothetical protein [Streptomyces rectiverticillatus]QLE70406.1 hypothetical protein FGW37_01195 [Streptomyces rectiverticillatus]
MTDPSAALVLSAATVLVNSMATDAWQATKDLFARVFGRAGDDDGAVIRAQLDRGAAQIARADDRERLERIRQVLVGSWQLELETLLRDHPEAEAELRAALAEIAPQQAGQSWQQTNIARDHGTTYAAQGGNVNHYTLHQNQVPVAPDPSGEPR